MVLYLQRILLWCIRIAPQRSQPIRSACMTLIQRILKELPTMQRYTALLNANNVVETKGALTEDHFLDALQKMWDHGAQGEYFAFVNANIKRMINQLAKAGNNVRFLGDNGSMQNVLGIGVQKIVTDFGEISLVLDRYADTKTILTVDLGEVQIAELRGTFYEDLPKAGDYYKGHVLNESTIKLLNSFAGSKISITEASL